MNEYTAEIDETSIGFELKALSEDIPLVDTDKGLALVRTAFLRGYKPIHDTFDTAGRRWHELAFGDRHSAFFLALTWSGWNPEDYED